MESNNLQSRFDLVSTRSTRVARKQSQIKASNVRGALRKAFVKRGDVTRGNSATIYAILVWSRYKRMIFFSELPNANQVARLWLFGAPEYGRIVPISVVKFNSSPRMITRSARDSDGNTFVRQCDRNNWNQVIVTSHERENAANAHSSQQCKLAQRQRPHT
jgi:hypothetical protein